MEEDIDSAKDGDLDIGFDFQNPLPPPPFPSSVAESFAACPFYPLPFFSFLFKFSPDVKDLRSVIEDLRSSHLSSLQ